MREYLKFFIVFGRKISNYSDFSFIIVTFSTFPLPRRKSFERFLAYSVTLVKRVHIRGYIDFKNQYVYEIYYLSGTKKSVLFANFPCFFFIFVSIWRGTLFEWTFHRSDHISFKKIEIDVEKKWNKALGHCFVSRGKRNMKKTVVLPPSIFVHYKNGMTQVSRAANQSSEFWIVLNSFWIISS